jgi:hypothetical protein
MAGFWRSVRFMGYSRRGAGEEIEMDTRSTWYAARSLYRRGLNPKFRTPIVTPDSLTRSGRMPHRDPYSPDCEAARDMLRTPGMHPDCWLALGRYVPPPRLVSRQRDSLYRIPSAPLPCVRWGSSLHHGAFRILSAALEAARIDRRHGIFWTAPIPTPNLPRIPTCSAA